MLPELDAVGDHRTLGEAWGNVGLFEYWCGRTNGS